MGRILFGVLLVMGVVVMAEEKAVEVEKDTPNVKPGERKIEGKGATEKKEAKGNNVKKKPGRKDGGKRRPVRKRRFNFSQYKRIHQHGLRLLIRDKAEESIAFLNAYLEMKPEDMESYFVLALAYAALGDEANAVKAAKEAVKRGVAVERFLAGPRGVSEKLVQMATKAGLFEKAALIVHGPMVGAVTDSGAKVWVRTTQVARLSYRFEALDKKGLHVGVSNERVTTTGTRKDFTGVMKLTGLQADREYRVVVKARVRGKRDNGERIETRVAQFRTSPKLGNAADFTLAFGGGAGFTPQHERMWDTIGKFNPQLMMLLGDNVYSDDPTSTAMQQYCYYRRQSRPEYRRLLARTPVYTIWDDHDFGTNDCWGGPEIDKPAWKRPVWRTYMENWVNPYYGGGAKNPGIYYDFYVGDVHFIMLDGRYYRTNPRAEKVSMLGPVQKAWLLKTLARSKGKVKVLCSPVPWDFRTKGDSKDTWNGFRREREEIFGFIEKRRIEGVILMSADRHRSDCWKIERENGYPFYEFNSSRLTNLHVHGEMKAAVFSYNKKQSFGLVRFDTKGKEPGMTYTVVNIDGKKIHSIKVKLSQLKFGKATE